MVSKKNMFVCSMLLVASCASGMDKYSLLSRNIKELSLEERHEYRRQWEEYRQSPEHLQHLVFNQVQLYKEAAENIEKEKAQKNLEKEDK